MTTPFVPLNDFEDLFDEIVENVGDNDSSLYIGNNYIRSAPARRMRRAVFIGLYMTSFSIGLRGQQVQ